MNTKELMAQLDALNKEISQLEYNDAIIKNNGQNGIPRVKMVSNIVSVDNLEVDGIQNQKYIDRIISVNAMIDFHNNGGIITKCPTKGIKKTEKTWVNNRGSIYNMGSKAATLGNVGINVRKG